MGTRKHAVAGAAAPAAANINEVLDGHVALEVECIDPLYLNAYVPNLQVGGQVVRFLTGHLGNPVPSPALFEKIGNRFRREVKDYGCCHPSPSMCLRSHASADPYRCRPPGSGAGESNQTHRSVMSAAKSLALGGCPP